MKIQKVELEGTIYVGASIYVSIGERSRLLAYELFDLGFKDGTEVAITVERKKND